MRRDRRALAAAAMTSMLASRTLTTSATTYTFEGEGTSYSLGEPSGGNCNLMNYPSDATTKYAALNAAQWDSTMNCGRCAQVTCTDAQCANAPQSSEIVYIVDQCPGCAVGDLDLSPEVFESITGLSYTRVSIEWSFVDCPVEGSIEYCLKTGSNSFWTAVQPTNMVAGVKSLSINGKATTMVDSAFYFLLDGNSQDATDLSQVTISMVGVNGEEVQDTVSFASEECVQGSSQFSTGNPSSEQDYELYALAASGSSATESTESPTATPAPVIETPEPMEAATSPTPTPTPTPTLAPTSTPTPTPTNPPSANENTQASARNANTTTVAADADPTSLVSPTPSPTSLRANTTSSTTTTPTIIGLGVLLLVGLVVLAAVAINARRKKIALRTKQSQIDDDMDRISTVLSPRSPSYLPAQTPTRNFAILY